MPTVSELVEVVSEATGEPLATVRMIARRLIDDEVLPKSVGARIPRVTHEHAASLLFAVMATPAIKDSSRTARTFAALVYGGRGDGTALEAVARLLRGLPKESSGLDWSMEVCTNFPQVVLKKNFTPQLPDLSERTDSGSLYIPIGEDRMHWPSDHLKRFAVLSGVGLYAIADALAGDE